MHVESVIRKHALHKTKHYARFAPINQNKPVRQQHHRRGSFTPMLSILTIVSAHISPCSPSRTVIAINLILFILRIMVIIHSNAYTQHRCRQPGRRINNVLRRYHRPTPFGFTILTYTFPLHTTTHITTFARFPFSFDCNFPAHPSINCITGASSRVNENSCPQ